MAAKVAETQGAKRTREEEGLERAAKEAEKRAAKAEKEAFRAVVKAKTGHGRALKPAAPVRRFLVFLFLS